MTSSARSEEAASRAQTAEGAEALPGVEERLASRRRGLGIALVSSSRNAARVLEATGLGERVDVRAELDRPGLRGEPSPRARSWARPARSCAARAWAWLLPDRVLVAER